MGRSRGVAIGAALGHDHLGGDALSYDPAVRAAPTGSAAVALVPVAIGASVGYASFASALPVVAPATMIGGALGLLCGVMEASAAARRGRDSAQ